MVEIESRTINSRVFLAATDIAEVLRTRAADYETQADELGEPLDEATFTNAVAYQAVAREMRQCADRLDCAVIEHISEPG